MEEMPAKRLLDIQNQSTISAVLIRGFQLPLSYRLTLFGVFLVLYVTTLSCNLLIILLIGFSRCLHTPMYMFLSSLSLSEILFTSNLAPPMLLVLLRGGAVFSIVGCLTQFYLFGLFAVVECLLLLTMSYDRFLAICRPLQYRLIMDPRLCLCLILFCWTLAFSMISISFSFLETLYFCRANAIDHFFCDFLPLLKLSCSDTSTVETVVTLLSSAATMFPFLLIVVTYVFIIRAIGRISSSKGKKKAFSTCSSHLGVVFTYYGTLFMVYVVPPGHLLAMNKVLSLLYTVMTPLMNPFIYTLRNQEIRTAIRQAWMSRNRF
ncbi:olfactory receptor 1N1-like [Gastrophryne carolinensis]